MKNLLILLLLFIVAANASAQKDKPKFGKVEMSDLEMKVYDKDTSAVAVVLYDYGEFDGRNFTFTRFTRIKILKKAGYGYANRIYSDIPSSNIDGITYNLENGQIVKSKLKSESIFNERVYENFYNTRVAMPNVKEGSVIDIQINFVGFSNVWQFQYEIPVKWSELHIDQNKYVRRVRYGYYDQGLYYSKNYFGLFPITTIEEGHWTAENVPAIKTEPHISSLNNYITKFEFTGLLPNGWESISKTLDNNKFFGVAISNPSDLKQIGKEITLKYKNPEEKLKAAVDAIKIVKWNNIKSRFTTASPISIAFKNKVGNSADINLLLYQLLQDLDIESYPVVLSSRDNGILSPIYPSIFKLNYVIVYAKIGDKIFLVDGTEKYLPYNLLPERCINSQGRVLYSKEKTDWVSLETTSKSKNAILCNLTIDDDLNITGKVRIQKVDYAAFHFRKKMEKFTNQSEYAEEMQKDYPALSIKNLAIDNIDSIYKPVIVNYDIKMKNQILAADSDLYFKPFLFEAMTENPFKMDTRQFPIDFAYGSEKNMVFIYTIPDKYIVKSMPEPISMSLPDKAGNLSYNISATGNKITINYKMSITKTLFMQSEYGIIKEFYAQVIKKNDENIRLKLK